MKQTVAILIAVLAFLGLARPAGAECTTCGSDKDSIGTATVKSADPCVGNGRILEPTITKPHFTRSTFGKANFVTASFSKSTYTEPHFANSGVTAPRFTKPTFTQPKFADQCVKNSPLAPKPEKVAVKQFNFSHPIKFGKR